MNTDTYGPHVTIILMFIWFYLISLERINISHIKKELFNIESPVPFSHNIFLNLWQQHYKFYKTHGRPCKIIYIKSFSVLLRSYFSVSYTHLDVYKRRYYDTVVKTTVTVRAEEYIHHIHKRFGMCSDVDEKHIGSTQTLHYSKIKEW